ncbi:MAG: tetratricopeptide repeat protein, partial [Waterburya sp.]
MMKLPDIKLIALLTFLVTITTPLVFNFLSFPVSLVLAQTQNDRKAEADRLRQQGIDQYYRGQYKEALKSSQQAFTIYQEIGDREGEGKCLNNFGAIYRALGEFEQAIEYSQQSLVITRKLKDKPTEVKSLYNLGIVYSLLGQYQKAIKYLQQSLDITRKIGDKYSEASSLIQLGVVYRNLGQYQKAIEFHQQSLDIAKKLESRQLEKKSLANLGVAYHFLKQYQKAIEFHEQSIAMQRELGEEDRITLGYIIHDYFALGQYQKAQEYVDIARELQDKLREDNAPKNIESLYNRRGQNADPTTALYEDLSTVIGEGIKTFESLRPGLTDANKVSFLDTFAYLYGNLQNTHIAQNKTEKALEIAERGKARALVELVASGLPNHPDNQLSIDPPTIQQIKQISQQ